MQVTRKTPLEEYLTTYSKSAILLSISARRPPLEEAAAD